MSDGKAMRTEVRGWTTHDSPIKLSYHGETLDLLTLTIPASPLPANGGPERRTTIHLRDLRAALSLLSPPAEVRKPNDE